MTGAKIMPAEELGLTAFNVAWNLYNDMKMPITIILKGAGLDNGFVEPRTLSKKDIEKGVLNFKQRCKEYIDDLPYGFVKKLDADKALDFYVC